MTIDNLFLHAIDKVEEFCGDNDPVVQGCDSYQVMESPKDDICAMRECHVPQHHETLKGVTAKATL